MYCLNMPFLHNPLLMDGYFTAQNRLIIQTIKRPIFVMILKKRNHNQISYVTKCSGPYLDSQLHGTSCIVGKSLLP